jgi:acetolactate synthase-1/2/3 large subunit
MSALPDAVYGEPHSDHQVVVVPADLAPRYAEAHRRLTRRRAAVHVGDGVLVDPATGAPFEQAPPPERWREPGDEAVATLDAARRPVMLAGPGVIDDDAVADLHAFAVAGSLGVLNTWGAKGIFDWRSRHHLATVGLQARDFELGGLADADLIVAVGVDEREAVADWRLAPTLTLDPCELGPAAELMRRERREIDVPPVRAGLAAITMRGWERTDTPLAPTKATQHYSQLLGGGGLVAADPGMAGYWVARTFGTSGLGGAQVPSAADSAGFAVAAATVARLRQPSRRVLAVVDALDEPTGRALDVAARLGVSVAVEVWDGAEGVTAAEHVARLEQLVVRGGTASLAIDPRQLDEMVELAGPIVAWTV